MKPIEHRVETLTEAEWGLIHDAMDLYAWVQRCLWDHCFETETAPAGDPLTLLGGRTYEVMSKLWDETCHD